RHCAVEPLLARERAPRRRVVRGEHRFEPRLDARASEIVDRQKELVEASALGPVTARRVVAPIRQDHDAADVVDDAAEGAEVGRPARLAPAQTERLRAGAGGGAERGEEAARHERRHHHERGRRRAEAMPEEQADAEADRRPQQVVLGEPHQEAGVLSNQGRLRRAGTGAREGVERTGQPSSHERDERRMNRGRGRPLAACLRRQELAESDDVDRRAGDHHPPQSDRPVGARNRERDAAEDRHRDQKNGERLARPCPPDSHCELRSALRRRAASALRRHSSAELMWRRYSSGDAARSAASWCQPSSVSIAPSFAASMVTALDAASMPSAIVAEQRAERTRRRSAAFAPRASPPRSSGHPLANDSPARASASSTGPDACASNAALLSANAAASRSRTGVDAGSMTRTAWNRSAARTKSPRRNASSPSPSAELADRRCSTRCGANTASATAPSANGRRGRAAAPRRRGRTEPDTRSEIIRIDAAEAY